MNTRGEIDLQLVMPVTHDAARLYRQIDGTTIPEAIRSVLAQRNIGGGSGSSSRRSRSSTPPDGAASSLRLFDAIDTIMGGGTGDFNMNQITARYARPENVDIDPDRVSAWNLLDIIKETFLVHRRQFLPLEVSIVLGIMIYHRQHGFIEICEDDARFWFNLVNIALGGEHTQQHEEGMGNNAAFTAIHREVMRVYFSNDDEDDDDNNDDDDTPGGGGGNAAGAA